MLSTFSCIGRLLLSLSTFLSISINIPIVFIDFNDKKVKEEGAEEFAKYLALSQKNLNQLKQRFIGKSIF